MKYRCTTIKTVASCPSGRLDAEHYLPHHRTWECNHGSKLRTKTALINAWLDGKITSEQFQHAMRVVK